MEIWFHRAEYFLLWQIDKLANVFSQPDIGIDNLFIWQIDSMASVEQIALGLVIVVVGAIIQRRRMRVVQHDSILTGNIHYQELMASKNQLFIAEKRIWRLAGVTKSLPRNRFIEEKLIRTSLSIVSYLFVNIAVWRSSHFLWNCLSIEISWDKLGFLREQLRVLILQQISKFLPHLDFLWVPEVIARRFLCQTHRLVQ